MKSTETKIDTFSGGHRFLSNFYPAVVHYEGLAYPSVEHAYQAAKTLDESLRHPFMTMTSGQAKKAGKLLVMRPDWELVKLSIMEALVREKFTVHVGLQELLLATGSAELIEGNWWGDVFWGVCRGKGENHLGELLMKIRQDIRTGAPIPTPSVSSPSGG